uniref:UPF0474 protein CG13624 n=1 Tax=Aceria tosichella TaxID=561515 RepID=A0A6G1SQ38_9ACAR
MILNATPPPPPPAQLTIYSQPIKQQQQMIQMQAASLMGSSPAPQDAIEPAQIETSGAGRMLHYSDTREISQHNNQLNHDNQTSDREAASEILMLVLTGGPKWGFRIKQLNDNRVIVSRIDKGPAERSGLQVYDELLSVNHVELSDSPRSLLLHDYPEHFSAVVAAATAAAAAAAAAASSSGAQVVTSSSGGGGQVESGGTGKLGATGKIAANGLAASSVGDKTPLLGLNAKGQGSGNLEQQHYARAGPSATAGLAVAGCELSKLDFAYQLIKHSSASNNNKLVLMVRRFLNPAYARASALAASNMLAAWNFSSSSQYRPSISQAQESSGQNQSQQQQQQQQQQHPSQEQQQSTISSSMIKSYSTLAQSLSTGPKLLKRYQQNDPTQHIHQQYHTAAPLASSDNTQQTAATNRTSMTGAVVPQCAMQICDSPMGHLQGPKRICPNHCYKQVNVESSISAADSTAENQLSSHTSSQQPMGPCYVGQSATTVTRGASHMDPSQVQISRSSDMKVLSSLLNSNKYTTGGQPGSDPNLALTNKDNYNQQQQQQQVPCDAWSNTTPCNQNIGGQPIQPVSNVNNNSGPIYPPPAETFMSGQNGAYNRQDSSSIPVNGRPITLTPLVSNNVSISQRPPAMNQQQLISSKSKTPTFIQPASPSTSSTTSSSGNTEITSPASAFTKKQNANNTPNPSGRNTTCNQQSERSGRPNSMSTDCSLSSHDEGFSSQIDQDDCGNSTRDSDDESDIDSDDESFYGDYTNNDLIGASISDNPNCKWTLNMGRTRRNGQRRFFWQYNVQSKGPKGTRICAADGAEDPFVLPEASDPVFSNECQVEGVKHSGKARRGDGNDLTPNPRKLLMIGLELKKLSKIINDLAPVTDLPINARNKTRKEKNKLASRACRLKKKAQHEANKIKLYGLQREHQQVVMAIFDARKMIYKALTQHHSVCPADNQLSTSLKRLLDQCLMTVAGQTGDYVNSVLEKVVSGCIDGGLQA